MALLTIVRRTASLWWRNWPWLVAIYLVGWLLRYWVLQAAVAVGLAHGVLWGTFVVVLAPIVRLLSYLAMFLVIRSSTEELQHVRVDTERRGVFDTVTSAILPFLVIYTVWQLIAEDYSAFLSAVDYTAVQSMSLQRVDQISSMASGLRLWIVVVVAFTVRWLITRLREKLPKWTLMLAVYFDVLWLFVAIQASAAVLFASPRWLSERRVVVWLTDVRDNVFSHFAFLADAWSIVGGLLGALVAAAGLALAWLAIANTVYGSPLEPTWGGARRALLGHRGDVVAARAIERGQRGLGPRWQRIPSTARSRATEFFREQLGRFGPIVDAGKLILHGGAVPVAFFVLTYTVLVALAPGGAYFNPDVTDGYLWRGVALALGPHDWVWWQGVETTIRAAIGALVDPVRICLVAAAYWYCVDQVRAQETEPSSGLELDHRP